eukprot:12280050-Alexandrium_andersonii.AAC.1
MASPSPAPEAAAVIGRGGEVRGSDGVIREMMGERGNHEGGRTERPPSPASRSAGRRCAQRHAMD